jgi:hypothetical protein
LVGSGSCLRLKNTAPDLNKCPNLNFLGAYTVNGLTSFIEHILGKKQFQVKNKKNLFWPRSGRFEKSDEDLDKILRILNAPGQVAQVVN